MANGQQVAEHNAQTFATWIASKTDDDFRLMTHRGVLSRKEIAKECGFGKSALDQNPRIKIALRELEKDLRKRAVLPPVAESEIESAAPSAMPEVEKHYAFPETERLRRLEQENASLKAENTELKRLLEHYASLRDALSLTGRIPR